MPAKRPTDPVLTPRLVLTPVGPDDVDDLALLYSDPAVAYWTGPWTRATVEAWAAGMAARWTADGVGKWMARDRSDGSLVGRGGFTRIDLDGETVLELGWAVRDARTGRGYATELGRAALAWAAVHQPDLPVVAFTEVHNRASRVVMERLGMRPAGILRREGLIEGRTGVHPDAPFALYRQTRLPTDGHVHSEWSWDAPLGSMERSCAQAVDLGLPAIVFTEHVDHTAWRVALDGVYRDDHLLSVAAPDGLLTPPAFDASGYLEAIERCRDQFPSLRVLSGLELGEPHWHAAACAKVLGAGRFDRVLGSLHCLPLGDEFSEPPGIYERRPAGEVVRQYLAEVARLVADSGMFAVLAHIDYPIRYWPQEQAGPFDPSAFEEEFRHALRATAQSGRALEISTRIPLHSTILRWWHEENGDAVTFGSDAHLPSAVANGLREAAYMAEAHGFRPGRNPYDFWARVD